MLLTVVLSANDQPDYSRAVAEIALAGSEQALVEATVADSDSWYSAAQLKFISRNSRAIDLAIRESRKKASKFEPEVREHGLVRPTDGPDTIGATVHAARLLQIVGAGSENLEHDDRAVSALAAQFGMAAQLVQQEETGSLTVGRMVLTRAILSAERAIDAGALTPVHCQLLLNQVQRIELQDALRVVDTLKTFGDRWSDYLDKIAADPALRDQFDYRLNYNGVRPWQPFERASQAVRKDWDRKFLRVMKQLGDGVNGGEDTAVTRLLAEIKSGQAGELARAALSEQVLGDSPDSLIEECRELSKRLEVISSKLQKITSGEATVASFTRNVASLIVEALRATRDHGLRAEAGDARSKCDVLEQQDVRSALLGPLERGDTASWRQHDVWRSSGEPSVRYALRTQEYLELLRERAECLMRTQPVKPNEVAEATLCWLHAIHAARADPSLLLHLCLNRELFRGLEKDDLWQCIASADKIDRGRVVDRLTSNRALVRLSTEYMGTIAREVAVRLALESAQANAFVRQRDGFLQAAKGLSLDHLIRAKLAVEIEMMQVSALTIQEAEALAKIVGGTDGGSAEVTALARDTKALLDQIADFSPEKALELLAGEKPPEFARGFDQVQLMLEKRTDQLKPRP